MNITLNAILRRLLVMKGLPLHYYVPMLVMGVRGLEEMHFDSLQKVKHVVLTVDAANEATLPVDYVEAVSVGLEYGDKIRTIGFNDDINARDNSNTAFPNIDQQYRWSTGLPGTDTFFYDEFGQFRSGQYGRNVTWEQSYTINRDLGILRVDNDSNITEIHLIYLSLPEMITNQSVIHPFAQQSLTDYINWKWAEYTNDPNQMVKRKEFYNQYRILRGRMNKMTTAEIKRSIRRNIKLSVKS